LNFSFSGLKTQILYFIQKNVVINPNFIEENKADICASIQHTIIEILMDKLKLAVAETRINQIKFLNEIKQDLYDTTKDGLNSCMYQIIGDTHIQNYHRLSVLI
jgi:tRNA A37 threonylcarbamoyltransferase TsaD